jgi:hypothetical protein
VNTDSLAWGLRAGIYGTGIEAAAGYWANRSLRTINLRVNGRFFRLSDVAEISRGGVQFSRRMLFSIAEICRPLCSKLRLNRGQENLKYQLQHPFHFIETCSYSCLPLLQYLQRRYFGENIF